MARPKKTAAELQEMFRQRSRDAGPWPPGMSIVIYPLDDSWRIVVGYSDIRQTPFRDRLMALSCELRACFDLDEAAEGRK